MAVVAGIPGTISDEAKTLRWFRLDSDLPGRAYRADTPDGFLIALVSTDPVGKNGKVLWHLSLSHRDKKNSPDRCPTWDELKSAVYRLIQEDVAMVLIFPRRSAPYVNIHDTTLHLWESTEKHIDE